MTTLKEARKKGKLEDFIKEHENDQPADKDKLDLLIRRSSQDKKKPTEGTSKQGRS